jgi:hypothetical protein
MEDADEGQSISFGRAVSSKEVARVDCVELRRGSSIPREYTSADDARVRIAYEETTALLGVRAKTVSNHPSLV